MIPPSIPALHLVSWVLTIVWCLVVIPPTEPLFHRATLSCELAGSSAASLCSSHPLHGAVELETNRNFCDQGTPASSKSVHKRKISVVYAPNHLMCSCIPLLLLAAAQLVSAPRAHPMLTLQALPRLLGCASQVSETWFEVKFLRKNI